jgi:hypothetical protein
MATLNARSTSVAALNPCASEHNRSVILSLSKDCVNGASFDRSMFAVHPPKGIVPYYDSNLITFGGAYKNMYRFEGDWIQEFERLLARLCWCNASAFNEFADIRCNWQAEQAFDYAFAEPCSPPPKWTKSCLRIPQQAVMFDSAVNDHSPTL